MIATNWAFAGYTFPVDSLPTNGGDWDIIPKIVEHDPIGANVSVYDHQGFRSNRRTIAGDCTPAFRLQMKTFLLNATIGALTDGEARTVTSEIVKAEFRPMASNARWHYTLEFAAREAAAAV